MRKRLRQLLIALVSEGLDPGRGAAAVFLGVFLGITPIYGFQSLTALALATVLKLNKPLTFAATFINNPLLQPFLIVAGLQLGHLAFKGRLLATPADLVDVGGGFTMWLAGTMLLAVLLGAIAAALAYGFLSLRSAGEMRPVSRFLRPLFRTSPWLDRGFVRWKLRLDKIFGLLLPEDPGAGPVLDLGCGYGIALALAEFRQPGRRLIGCDLDVHRIEVARTALGPFRAELSVADIRSFAFDQSALILILDVLQYLNAEEQRALVGRCCAALLPAGKLIFRVPDPANRLSMAFDRLAFRHRGWRQAPVVLSPGAYRRMLEEAGLRVREHRFTNRLPLVQVLFIAQRPQTAAGEDMPP